MKREEDPDGKKLLAKTFLSLILFNSATEENVH